MSFKFTCPHCNQTIECENKFAGMTAPCPRYKMKEWLDSKEE